MVEDIEAFVANIGVYIWRVVEIAPDQMTTAESADDKALNERAATEAILQTATIKNLIVEKLADVALKREIHPNNYCKPEFY